jgi:sigma-E factor negative regulatory protein RseB
MAGLYSMARTNSCSRARPGTHRQFTWVVAGSLLLLAGALAQSAFAQNAAQNGAAQVADPHPVIERLQKMQAAARQLDYSGVYTHNSNGIMVSSRIVHVVDGTGERERLEILDGMPREYVRHNEQAQCLVPDKKQVLLERRRSDRFPSLLMGAAESIPAHYTVQLDVARNRIAGRECSVTNFIPKDLHRYGYRLCLDLKNNLLLKVQTLDHDGLVLEQIAFNTLELEDDVQPSMLEPSWDTKGWKVVENTMVAVDLARDGWRIPFPPGFEPVTQVARSMGQGKQVTQLVLADGLAAISIFIEPFRATEGKTYESSQATAGAMNVFRTRIGNYWMTALGEVPALTVRSIAEQTEFVPLGGAD